MIAYCVKGADLKINLIMKDYGQVKGFLGIVIYYTLRILKNVQCLNSNIFSQLGMLTDMPCLGVLRYTPINTYTTILFVLGITINVKSITLPLTF